MCLLHNSGIVGIEDSGQAFERVSVSIVLGAGKTRERWIRCPKAGKGVWIASGNASANSYTADGSERSLVNECRDAGGDLSADRAQPGDRRGRIERGRRGDLSRRTGASRPRRRARTCRGGAVPRHVEGIAA